MISNELIYVGVTVVIIAAQSFFQFRASKQTKLEFLKAKALELFLFAEKQGWTSAEKMDWCVDKMSEYVPKEYLSLLKVTLRVFLESVYDQFKKELVKEVKNAETQTH